jgi:hypothetical protein
LVGNRGSQGQQQVCRVVHVAFLRLCCSDKHNKRGNAGNAAFFQAQS